MSSGTSPVRLTAPARLARGLKYSAVGPIDVTRGVLGVSLHSARSSASWAGKRYRRARIADRLRTDLAIAQGAIADQLAGAQDAVTNLPQTLQGTGKARRRPRPLVLLGAGVAVLAVGAVTFSIVRRSTQPEPSTLQPSVNVTPKP